MSEDNQKNQEPKPLTFEETIEQQRDDLIAMQEEIIELLGITEKNLEAIKSDARKKKQIAQLTSRSIKLQRLFNSNEIYILQLENLI